MGFNFMVNDMKAGIKLIYGVGLNDAGYKVSGRGRCRFYSKWIDMLMRCYSDKYQSKHPSYIGCIVCDEWHSFSNFKAWMERQDWVDKNLDKDLLGCGKIYSPETCCFISGDLNGFLVEMNNGSLTGASWNKFANKFQSSCKNPITKKAENLGLYLTELEAHMAWRARKRQHATYYASKESDQRIIKALLSRYS